MSYDNEFAFEDDDNEFFEDDLEDVYLEDDEDADSDEDYEDDEADDNEDAEFFGERRRRRRRRGRGSPRAQVPNRSRLPVQRVQSNSSGVQRATLNTPRGQATIKLAEKVTPHKEFQAAVKRLSGAIAANTKRINTLQTDIRKVGESVNKLSKATDSKIAKLSIAQRKELAKLRKEQAAQRQNNMMLTLLTQQQIQSKLAEHTHAVATDPVTNTLVAQPSTNASSSDSMSMLLPLMFMSGGFGGSGGSGKDGGGMMPMLLMMTLMK